MAAEFEYGNLGRVTDIDYGESVVKFGYSYAADENNIYRKTFDHRSGDPYNEYTYDDLDRLTDAGYLVDGGTPDREDSFVMDGLGNRTGNQTLRDDTVNFTVQSSTNRYTSIGGHSIRIMMRAILPWIESTLRRKGRQKKYRTPLIHLGDDDWIAKTAKELNLESTLRGKGRQKKSTGHL